MSQLNTQEDTSYVVAFRGLEGAQIASVAATPLFLLSAIRRGRFSVHKLAQYNWVTPILGAATGSAIGWANAMQHTPPVLARRVEELRNDAMRIRRDDFHLIGAFIGAIAFPALFLRRAGLLNGFLGGAGFGGAIGLGTVYWREFAGDNKPADVPAPPQ